MPYCSHAKSVPVRPNPVWISSAISTMPCCVGNASQLVQKGRRRRNEAAFTEDRLDDERRNAVRRYDRVKELVERRERADASLTP